jgi:hypothetical protein
MGVIMTGNRRAYRYYSMQSIAGITWEVLGWSRTATAAARRAHTEVVVEASSRPQACRKAETGESLNAKALRRLARRGTDGHP